MSSVSNSTEGLTRRLAEHASSLTYDDLPEDVVAKVKSMILDILGTALAATTLGAGCREVVDVMRGLGGKPESTILGHQHKVSASNAAFANGALAHALNYDPIGPEVGHVGVVCLAAPLAMAEAIGGVSGRQFLAAAAVAAEVKSRVTSAIARTGRRASENFLAGQLLGYFGAAAGAGRLLGLTAKEMHSAFGLALMQASGSMQVVLSGDPPAKAVYGAFPNQGGVLAALLSKAGLEAEIDALEGPAGLYGMIYGGEYEAGAIDRGLGSEFLLMGAQFKPWPTSGVIHPFIEAALQIAGNELRDSEIKEVQIVGHSHIRAWCEPIEERRRPPNPAAAGNSVPFGVAKALCHGEVSLADFTAEGIRDEAAIAIAERTRYAVDEAMEGGIVKVVTTDGRSPEAYIKVPLGHPSRPVPYERLVAKFKDCCGYAITPLTTNDVDALIALVENLEEVDDMARLTMMASGNGGRHQG
jgi:2-methylcitrate dehydratase PrpD